MEQHLGLISLLVNEYDCGASVQNPSSFVQVTVGKSIQ